MTTDPKTICFTVDVEGDCPPYLQTYRGIEEGLDRLLDIFAEASVKATFFITGQIAVRYPSALEKMVSHGHELGSHGLTHQAFGTMDHRTAAHEIKESRNILRSFAPVCSFRAPYLSFPDAFRNLLVDAGYTIDSSQAKYKLAYCRYRPHPVLKEFPVSATSSVLRLSDWVRLPILRTLSSPVVLFVHPWEFVDLTRERLRVDCRFRTGTAAVERLTSAIGFFRAQDFRFLTMRELTP
jgi:peptidoglycan-N-acetylglucosamine deacetylase